MADIKDILEGRESVTEERVEETVEETSAEPEAHQSEQVEAQESSEGEKSPNGVPVAALQAERRKYKDNLAAVEQKLAESDAKWQQRFEQLLGTIKQPEPPPQAPDFWENPESAVEFRMQQVLTPIQQQLARQKEELSMLQAIDKHGQETVDAAFSSLKSKMSSDPSTAAAYQQIMSSVHPYQALVDWHKRQSAIDEIGNDPNAYREKLRAELLAELQEQQRASSPSLGVMPSNFSSSRNVGTRGAPAYAGPASIRDLLGK